MFVYSELKNALEMSLKNYEANMVQSDAKR